MVVKPLEMNGQLRRLPPPSTLLGIPETTFAMAASLLPTAASLLSQNNNCNSPPLSPKSLNPQGRERIPDASPPPPVPPLVQKPKINVKEVAQSVKEIVPTLNDMADAEAAEELLLLFGKGTPPSPLSPTSPSPTQQSPQPPQFDSTIESQEENKRKRKSSMDTPIASPILDSTLPDITTRKSGKAPIPRSKSEKWTEEEDAKLRSLVEKSMTTTGKGTHITDRWTKIAKLIGNKTSTQCFQHWHRVLNPDINKDPWTPEEEELLLKFVRENSAVNSRISWSTCAMNLKGRTDTQCRYQYIKLDRSKKVPWTKEEDRLLLELSDSAQQYPPINWVTVSQDLYMMLQRNNETRNKTPPRTSSDCKLRCEELSGKSMSSVSSFSPLQSIDKPDLSSHPGSSPEHQIPTPTPNENDRWTQETKRARRTSSPTLPSQEKKCFQTKQCCVSSVQKEN